MADTKKSVSLSDASTFVEKPKAKEQVTLSSGKPDAKTIGSGIGYFAANVGLGLAGIVEGTYDVINGTAASLFGGEEGKKYAKYLYGNDYTGELTQKLNDSYNPNKVEKFFGEAGQGIGQSSVFALNYSGIPIGSVLFFAGAGGRSIAEAYNTTGELGFKEYAYGVASSATELALEQISGGILKGAGMGGKTLQNTIFKGLSKVGKDTATTAVRNGFVKQVLSEASSEFIEEFLGSYTDVLWQRAFQVDPNASVTFGDAIYSGLVGAASGGLMSGVGNGFRATYSNYRGNQLIKEGKADNLVRTVETIQQYVKSNDWSKYANNGQITGVMNDLIAAYQAYNKLGEADRTGARAAVYLGEMQMNLAFLESAVGVAKISDKVKADAEAYVDFANRTWGKEYTAEDIRNNKDDVLHQLSVMRWAGQFAESETVGSRKMNWVREQLKRNQEAAGTTETDTDTTANAQTTNEAPQPTKTGTTADGIEYTENDLDGVTARVYNLGEGKNVVAVQNDNGTWSIEAGDSENLASDLGELIGTTVKDKNLDGEIKNIRDNYDALVDKARKTAEARKAQEADNNTETDNKAQKGSDKATKGKLKEESKTERDSKAGKVVEGTKNTRYATADDLKLAGIETSKVIKSKLDMKQKATAILFDKWFAKSGLQLMLFEGNGSGRNGSYMANTIYVDINSSMFQVAAHELVHSFKARSAEMYKSIESFIVDKAFKGDVKLLDEAIKRYQELYNKNGIVLDYEGAKEELIAKSCEKVFGSVQGLKDILSYNKKLFNAANKFFASMESFFQDIIDESGEANQYAEAMAASLEDITELRKRFAQAMAESTKNGKSEKAKNSIAEDSDGNILSDKQQKFFKDSKIRDKKGNLLVVYHGTDSEFYTFDMNKAGKTGRANGYGFYTTPSKTMAEHYGSRLIKGYVNITKPLSPKGKTITKSQLKNFINAIVDNDLKLNSDEIRSWKDSFLSDYCNTYELTRDAAITKTADFLYNSCNNDVDLVFDIAVTDGYNSDSKGAKIFYDVLTKTLGYDGMWQGDEIIAFNSNQIKDIDNKNPTSNPDIRFSVSDDYFSENRGNGYDGYSMSNNARAAYESGEMPLSKWSKSEIIDAVSNIDEGKAKLLEKVNLATLKKELLSKTSWHHTSEYFNKTDFYTVDEDKLNELTTERIDELSKQKETKAQGKEYRGDIKYLEWSGTRNHPKAKDMQLTDVNIEERGSFYIVTDDNGNELLRKKIGSNGTSVTNYEAVAKAKAYEEARKKTILDNSSERAKELYLSGDYVSASTSGHVYERNRKPSRFDYDKGIEKFFKAGEQRLALNGKGGYDVETWNGSEWIAEEPKYSVSEDSDALFQKLVSSYKVGSQEQIEPYSDVYEGVKSKIDKISHSKILVNGEWKDVYHYLDAEKTREFETYKEAEDSLISAGYTKVKDKLGLYNWINQKAYDKVQERNAYNESIKAARIGFSRIAEDYIKSIGEKVYIRFGKIPESGRSFNFADNKYENGISAYEAYKIGDKYAVIPAHNPFTFLGYVDNKTAYLIEGDLLSEFGSDDEPLFKHAKIVKKIEPSQIDSYRNVAIDIVENATSKDNDSAKYSISDNLTYNTFSATAQDEARKLVDNFDIYSYDTKRSIIEFMRSAAGTKADKDTIKTVANIIASTEDLDVRFAESNQNGELSSSQEGYRLIILNKNLESAQQIRQTLAAEIIHLSEDTKTYGKFAKMVLANTTPEEQEAVKAKYKAYYDSINVEVDNDTLLKECVSELGSNLIQQYDIVKKWSEADKKLVLRLVYSARNLARSLFGKDKEAYKAAAKMSGTITAAFGESVLRKAVGAPAVKWSLADDNVALKEKTERQQRVIRSLQDYIKLQQTVTNGKTVSREDIAQVASKLMLNNQAKGDRNELLEILVPMYQAIYDVNTEETTKRAYEASEWLFDHYVPKEKYNEDAAAILNTIKGVKIYLSEDVRKEIVNRYESISNYQKQIAGTIVISNDKTANTLDQAWQEWSDRFGGIFDAEENYLNQPEKLAEIVTSLKNTESYGEKEHYHYAKEIKDQIFDAVLQASADVGFTTTLADKYEKKLAEQKQRLNAEIDALKAKNKEKLEKLKQENKQLTKELQNQARSIHYFTRANAKARINEIVNTYIAKYFGEGTEKLARDFAADNVNVTSEAKYKVTGIDNLADRLYKALYEDMTPGQMKKAAKEFAAEIINRTKLVQNGKEIPVTEALDGKNISLSIIAENEIKERIFDMLNGGEIRGEEEQIKIRYENMFKRAQEEFNKRMNTMQNEINNATGTQKAILQSIEQIARTRKQYKDGQYRYNGILATDQVKVLSDFILKAKTRGGFLDAAGVRNALLAYKAIFTNGDITTALNEEYTVLGLNYESLTELNQAVYEVIGDLNAADEHEMTKKLTAREIETFSDVAKAVAQLYRTYNKYYDEKRKEWIDADETATKAIRNVEKITNLQATDKKLVKTFKNLMTQYGIEALDPLAVAKLFDGYADDGVMTELMSDIINAENAKTYRIQQYMKAVDDFISKTKGFEKHLTSEADMIEYRGVKLTRDEFIQLYMTTFRKQALLHLGMGRMEFGTPGSKYGLRILEPAIKTLGGADAMKKIDDATIEDFMTESEKIARDIQQLGDKVLTSEDKQYIALMEKFYNVTSTQDKSAADYKYFGMTNVIEDPLDRYVPIVTSRSSRASSVTDERSAIQDFSTLSGQSFNKNTIRGAKNPLSFTGAYGLMAKHANGLAAYVELYSAFQKLDRIWSTDINHDKQNSSRLRDVITNAYGKQSEQYIQNLMGDVQGINRKQPNAFNPIISKLRSNYAIFQLGANPKTWFNQLGSMGALVRFCDVDCITKGIAAPNKADMAKYSNAAAIREGSDVVVKAQTLTAETKNKLTEIAMKPIGIADMKIVEMSWGACQYQIEKTKGFAVGTEENKKAAGQLLNKVINESQDTSMASTKTGIARSENDLIKGLAMFRSAPFKQYSRLVDAVGTLAALNARKKAGEAVSEARMKAATTELCRTAAGWTMQAVIGIAVTAGFNWLYAKDDDDKTMADRFWEFLGEMLSVVPILGDVYSFFVDGFDMSYFAYDMVNDAADATKKTVSLVGDTFNGKKVSRQDVAKQIYNNSQVLGQFTGIPVRNVKNFITGIVKRVSKTFGGSLGYELDASMYSQSYNADLTEALANGNTKLANTVINLLYRDKKATSELSSNVATEILNLYGKGYTNVLPATIGDKITVDGQEYTIGAAEQKKIRSIANGADKTIVSMMQTESYKALSDDEKAKAIKSIYTVYYDKAINDVFGIPMSKYQALSIIGDAEDIFTAAAHISGIESEKDANGKVVANSRKNLVSEYISSLNVDESTAYLILYAAGYSSDSLKEKVADIAASSKITNEEYTEILEALNIKQ